MTMTLRVGLAACMAALALPTHAVAQTTPFDNTDLPVTMAADPALATPLLPEPAALLDRVDAQALKPGEYRWQPDLQLAGGLRIQVSLTRQRAFVYRGERLIGISTVSSGRDRHETPTGTFPILEKDAVHHSSIYNRAPMPFMQRLTWDGVALHAGALPGYRASHGCIRLPRAFAETLFRVTRVGTVVTVEA